MHVCGESEYLPERIIRIFLCFRTEIAHQKAHSSHALSEFQDFVGISKKMGSK